MTMRVLARNPIDGRLKSSFLGKGGPSKGARHGLPVSQIVEKPYALARESLATPSEGLLGETKGLV
ncbi:hypothetical protein CGRA01v4_14546 [Colletotrichum graminicola]|nr:hypothetical protein CGRA01v4_14546 [Colletotrichum graminicola]